MSVYIDAAESHNNRKRIWLWLVLPFVALVLMTIVFTLFDVDRSISSQFYRPADGWFLAKKPLWYWMYKKGFIPGVLLAVSCLLVWMLSFVTPRLREWRKPCLVVVLTTILGAGLLVNAIFKQYWGKPRPSQTIEYGGQWEYRPTFPPGTPGKGASFPSGHSTMGYLFLASLAFYPRSKKMAITGVGAGLVLGGLMSAARVVQGAHFPSDTLWAGGFVWLTAAGLTIWLPETPKNKAAPSSDSHQRAKRIRITIISVLAVLTVAGGLLMTRPMYRTKIYPLKIPATVATLNVQIDHEVANLKVRYADGVKAKLQVDAHGFGWHKFNYRQTFSSKQTAKQLDAALAVEAQSYFISLGHSLTITLPERLNGRLELLLNQQPITIKPEKHP